MYLEDLQNLLAKAIKEAGYDLIPSVILSNRPDLCDYQCDDCFKLAKMYGESPIVIGNKIVSCLQSLENFNDYFKEVTFANPGFINLTLSNTFISKYVRLMEEKEKFNFKPLDKKELFYLDYGGANIAKPLHVGHLRPAIIGESLKRILKFYGHSTLADAHLGDFGLQIGEVIYAILRDFKDVPVDDIKIDLAYLDKVYPEMSKKCKENEDLLATCQEITKELQDGNEVYGKLWKQICNVSMIQVKELYDFLGVDFDYWYGESECFPVIPVVKEALMKQGIVKESEGAKIIEVKKDTDKIEVPPFILEKSNGASLYSTTDLASIYERVERHHPDHILYVADSRQSLHFEQVFRASEKAGFIPYSALKHIGFGTINGKDGKPFKTRSGETVKLKDLLKEVEDAFLSLKETNKEMGQEDIDKIVNAIIKFADLQNSLDKNYIFDTEKFASVVGKTGPYILYTYLRIHKMIKEVTLENPLSSAIYDEYDRALRLKLLEMEKAVTSAVLEYRPHYICEYLYSLCVVANNFYQNDHLQSLTDLQKKNDYIHVLRLTTEVIKTLLDLLAIEIPSVM